MLLLTEFYEDPDPRRRDEFVTCLERNVVNDLVEEIHLFIASSRGIDELARAYPVLAKAKIRAIPQGKRATYRDLFGYANRQLAGRRVAIANADIYFDRTLARLEGYDLRGRLLCLSRWDVHEDGSASFFAHPASQDAWIFEAPVPAFSCDFALGVPACDNRLAWEAAQAGLTPSNPGRSVRANHLHLSRVRRYSERHRLAGPTVSLTAGFLGTPWLWFVVPCMGRLDELRRTAPSLLSQPRSTYVLVDYSCPDGAGRWAREQHPEIDVVEVTGRTRFRGAEARNRGAAHVDDDGVVCFLDTDTGAGPGFSDHVLTTLAEGSFLVADRSGPGLDSSLVCRKADFDRVRGFDEAFLDWAEECRDLRSALRSSGLAERSFPAAFLAPLDGRHRGSRSRAAIHDAEVRRAVHRGYSRAKAAILEETGAAPLPLAARREIYRAIARRHLQTSGASLDLACARVAFTESMGYTVARLEIGASSHNNDLRPFVAIPQPLEGLQFTQVVASRVSPVDVSFLTPGKLFVLVGNDWDGCHVARNWLLERAFVEGLPLAETRTGSGFEVWSLDGEPGERFVVPTQVMLVADELVKR